MISPWTIYLFTRLDAISSLLTGFIIAAVFAIVAGAIIVAAGVDIENDEWVMKGKKIIVVSIITALISGVVHTAIPSTKEMAAIYVIPKVVNNEQIQECATGLVELANDWIKELKPSSVKENSSKDGNK